MYPNLNTGALGINATFPEALQMARRHGYQGVDFSIVEVRNLVQEKSLSHVRSLLDEAGVGLGAWGLPINWRSDGATYEEGLRALPDWAALAEQLGCFRVLTVVMPGHDQRDYEANWQFHVERLRPIAEALDEHGCYLGLEFVGPTTLRSTFAHPFIYSMQGAAELAAAIGTGNVGMLVDLFHIYTSHGQAEDVGKLDAEQVVAVHINDGVAGRGVDEQMDLERALPGETGVTDIGAFLRALNAIGYDGPVTVEPFSERLKSLPPDERLARTIDSMRDAWRKADLTFPS